jgi:DNA-directed RNA polymerase subunit RPC12/RpoP
MAIKRMDRDVFGVEVLDAVKQVLAGEQAADRLRALLGFQGRDFVEALKHPPAICADCGKPFDYFMATGSDGRCIECRGKAKAQEEEARIQKMAEDRAKQLAGVR